MTVRALVPVPLTGGSAPWTSCVISRFVALTSTTARLTDTLSIATRPLPSSTNAVIVFDCPPTRPGTVTLLKSPNPSSTARWLQSAGIVVGGVPLAGVATRQKRLRPLAVLTFPDTVTSDGWVKSVPPRGDVIRIAGGAGGGSALLITVRSSMFTRLAYDALYTKSSVTPTEITALTMSVFSDWM